MAQAKRIVAAVEAAQKTPETSNERFRRLANFRLKQAIVRLRLLAQLGNDSYERRPEQVDIILVTLRDEVKLVEDRLRRGQEKPVSSDFI